MKKGLDKKVTNCLCKLVPVAELWKNECGQLCGKCGKLRITPVISTRTLWKTLWKLFKTFPQGERCNSYVNFLLLQAVMGEDADYA